LLHAKRVAKRRTAYDFLAEITETCQKPIGKTRLYHKIGATYRVFKGWLNAAIQLKLIENIGNKYHTTQKGQNFLSKWRELQAILKEES